MPKEKQIPPQGDERYRVHRSVKCYLAELQCGTKWCTWYFTDSIERVVYRFPGDVEKVIYKNKYYELRSPLEMKAIISKHLSEKGGVNLLGKSLSYDQKDKSFEPHPFIDITEPETYDEYEKLRSRWLSSKEYKSS